MLNDYYSDDLWPKAGDWLRYYFNDVIPYDPWEPRLTMGNEYLVLEVSFVVGADRIKIADDNRNVVWVEMAKFTFETQHEFEMRNKK